MINLDVKCWSEIEEKHINYVKDFVEQRLGKILNKVKHNNKSINLTDKKFLRTLFSELLDKNILDENKKYSYFVGKDFEKLNLEFENLYLKFYKVEWKLIKEKNKLKQKDYKNMLKIKEILNYILNYDAFSSTKGWNRHKFLIKIGIKVCPYCNRNYITSFNEKSGEEKTTADADHYYVKTLYPILQMNIYNLIPSCQICNSRMKLDSDIRHLYPYNSSNEDNIKFYLNYNSIEELYSFSAEALKINLKILNNQAESAASIKLFKLVEVYEIHNNIIYDIIEKVKIFTALKELSNELNHTSNVDEVLYLKLLLGKEISRDFNINSFDLKDIWFDFMNDKTDVFDEPLLKLKRDIYMQLKEYLPELN